ncbi:opsin 6, group member a [Ictalurus punctatus]|uniref:Opsin 6, group member a n=1 Tax=Ictalurus punctatus TaxID=7998 RepID=A0A2D0RV42_ICTPU|nr:opsin 6, group member a [Ictalurus punctatus]
MSSTRALEAVNIPWRNNNFSLLSKDAPLSDQGDTIIGVYLLLLGWLSWFGNSIVIFVLFKQKATLQPTDYLTLNLAISDASISVFGYSRGILEIFNVFRDNGYLITSVWTCQVDGFFTLLFGLGSITTLSAISVTRYIKGCHPSKAHCITNNTVGMSILFIWISAVFWSAAPLVGWGSYIDRGYGTCEIDWAKANYSTIHKSYIITILILCFFVPVFIMLFCYVSIINTVKRGNAMSADGDLTDRQRKIERDVTIVSVVVCTAFVLAWSPYAVVSIWSACGFHVPSLTSIFTRLFAKSASFYNPLIYFGLSYKFRKDVAGLMPCTRHRNDPVKLKRYTHVKAKGDEHHRYRAEGHYECIPAHQQAKKEPQARGINIVPSPDSGLCSHPRTPPPFTKQVHFIQMPETSESLEYESDRL